MPGVIPCYFRVSIWEFKVKRISTKQKKRSPTCTRQWIKRSLRNTGDGVAAVGKENMHGDARYFGLASRIAAENGVISPDLLLRWF